MINQPHELKCIAADLDPHKEQRIKDFIQGSVYCFCKNSPDQWFSARDLFGGKNYFWSKTPLYELYHWHEQNRANDAIAMAGKDIGWLLLDVLDNDKRVFDLNKGFVNEYKWTGEENN